VNAVCDSTLHIDHYYITHFVTIIMFHVRTWNIIIVTKRVMLNHVISVLFLFYLNKLHILCTTSPQIIFSTWNIIIVTKRVMLNHVISVLFLFYLNKLHILCTTSPQIIFSYAKSFNRSLKAAAT